MNFKDVPIPSRMEHLPRDRRGYPIPEGVFVDTDGRPHFTINDEAKRQEHISKDRCPICGSGLMHNRWLVGGAASAFSEHGAYIDPPMHKECAVYALQTCPYLAAPSYAKRIDDKTLDPEKVPGGVLMTNDPTMIENRPDPFVLVMFAKEDQLLIIDEVTRWVKYVRPTKLGRVEFWSKGIRLSNNEGIAKSAAYMKSLGIAV